MDVRARIRSSFAMVSLATLAAATVGCPGTPHPRPAARGARGPRLKQRIGEERGAARLVLEVDPRSKPVGPPTLHTFSLSVEEKISALDQGGALVTARLVDVAGASGEPKLSDQIALVMDDLKISFRRTDRGDVLDLKIEGLRAPLDEPTAHAMMFALFAAGRGPRLPEREVVLLDDWTVESDTDVVGVSTHLRQFYTLLGENGAELQFRTKGQVQGIATVGGVRRSVRGETFAEETLDLARGVVVTGEYEWNVQVNDDPADRETPGVGRTRVRVERGRAAQRKK